MTSQMVLTIGRDALTLLLMISMPVLGVVMAVAAGRLPAMNAPPAAMGFSSLIAGPGGRPR